VRRAGRRDLKLVPDPYFADNERSNLAVCQLVDPQNVPARFRGCG
jgi:hypothetical protein